MRSRPCTHEHEAKITRVAADPGTPYWARDIIATALAKDPVDAAAVLDRLAKLFNERSSAILRCDLERTS